MQLACWSKLCRSSLRASTAYCVRGGKKNKRWGLDFGLWTYLMHRKKRNRTVHSCTLWVTCLNPRRPRRCCTHDLMATATVGMMTVKMTTTPSTSAASTRAPSPLSSRSCRNSLDSPPPYPSNPSPSPSLCSCGRGRYCDLDFPRMRVGDDGYCRCCRR